LLLLGTLNLGATCQPKPPDVPICFDTIDPKVGFCRMTFSEKEFIVDETNKFEVEINGKKVMLNWEQLKVVSPKTPPSTWSKIKVFMLDVCNYFSNCPDVEKKISEFEQVTKKYIP
jgi:hypothetical protein